MAQISSDNPVEKELQKRKLAVQGLQQKIPQVINSFATLPAPERARVLQEINNGLSSLRTYVQTVPKDQLTNAGARFTLENLKTSLSSLEARWRKFERSLG